MVKYRKVSLFNKIIFPHLKRVDYNIVCQNNQMALTTIDTFKGQGNDALANLYINKDCVIVIVPHNLTNKFQLLDNVVNKPAKCVICEN